VRTRLYFVGLFLNPSDFKPLVGFGPTVQLVRPQKTQETSSNFKNTIRSLKHFIERTLNDL